VLAVFGRAEARDFIDLFSVEDRYGLRRLCELAAEKDGGYSVAMFSEMLGRFDRLRRDEFETDDPGYERLTQAVRLWREQALDLAPGSDLERAPENDIGLDL